MDQSGPPQPDNHHPVAAIKEKVKSAFTSHQRPSVRILRQPASNAEKGLPRHGGSETQPEQGAPPNQSRFASVRSFFTHDDEKVHENEYSQDDVDFLDVYDPEVSTLSTLTNVQNSLFVPSMGKMVNRRATYRLDDETRTIDKLKAKLKALANVSEGEEEKSEAVKMEFAVLPDGITLQGWTKEEKEQLDDMVRHQLHSKRAKTKRALKGFTQYVRRPLGLFITIYATTITLFGAAWVLFLIGWISIGSKQSYIVNIVDNVLVALFAIIGDSLAPFRAVDTYHMAYIAYYHRLTWKTRTNLGLPELVDRNDLPEQGPEEVQNVDLERGLGRRMTGSRFVPQALARRFQRRAAKPEYEYSVLTPEQQAKLEHHERKFSKSHTFYKPHETATHYAFPLKLVVAIVLLLDLHSCLQITLGACTWGINYKTRPFALTTVVLCCSITANITGGYLISRGDKKTRKHDVIERMQRQELTEEAIREMEDAWLREGEERGDVDPAVRKRIEEERARPENEEIKKSWKNVPALPKILLGKGEDTRQPALPREMRSGSNVNVDGKGDGGGAGGGKEGGKEKGINRKPLPPMKEEPARPEPVKEGVGRKALRMVRKADLDRS